MRIDLNCDVGGSFGRYSLGCDRALMPYITSANIACGLPAGSVGIAGAQTGIYPLATPGGWQIIGRTPLRLFDPQKDPPTLLHPGDRVHFVPIGPDRFAALGEQEWGKQEQPPTAMPVPGSPGLEVLQPGLLTTIQDLGRRDYERFGVPGRELWTPLPCERPTRS